MQGLRDYFNAFLLLLHPESASEFPSPHANASPALSEPLPSGLAQALQNIGLHAALNDAVSLTNDERTAFDA